MGTNQKQVLGAEYLQQSQELFRKYTAVDEAIKNQIVTAVEPVFLSPLVDYMIGFGQVSELIMLQHPFTGYEAIDEIDLKENKEKIMGPYDHVEPLDRLIEELEKGREFARSVGQKISDAMMVSKGITLLAHTAMFSEDIREWRLQTNNQKT